MDFMELRRFSSWAMTHGFVTALPWETYSGTLSYEEPYNWYTDYVRTRNAEFANPIYNIELKTNLVMASNDKDAANTYDGTTKER